VLLQAINDLFVVRESSQPIALNDDVAAESMKRAFKHVEPAAHHADDHQHHCGAENHRDQADPGNPPFQKIFENEVKLVHESKLQTFDQSRGFMRGNRITSRMLSAPVSIITSRSMPSPIPPAGGMPCSSAKRKSSSSFSACPSA